MRKFDFKSFAQFVKFLRNLPVSRSILYTLYFILILLYPGQNSLQTIVINPGPIHAYTLPPPTHMLYPQSDGAKIPSHSARAVVIQDVESRTILYSKYPDTLLLPASLTKIMTALVALDYWSDLSTVITVKNEDRAIGQTIDLVKGEEITIRSILAGLLIHSGNDAALAVADNYPGGYDAFVVAMNQKAKDLHLDHTTFKNPSGVEQYGHQTTARDLAVLASYALQNPVIANMASTKHLTVTDITGTITHDLESTNELLGIIPGLKGLKTGWTTGAGECLVSYIERDNHKIIIVVLGSLDRFGDSTRLIDWAFAHHNWITPNL